jgi:hypothetical protein
MAVKFMETRDPFSWQKAILHLDPRLKRAQISFRQARLAEAASDGSASRPYLRWRFHGLRTLHRRLQMDTIFPTRPAATESRIADWNNTIECARGAGRLTQIDADEDSLNRRERRKQRRNSALSVFL